MSTKSFAVTAACVSSNTTDRSDVTGYLLSTFNRVGSSMFEPGGVPASIVRGGGAAAGSGFALAPNPAAFTSRFDATNPMDRLPGVAASQSEGLDALSGNNGRQGFRFSFDTRSLLASARRKQAMRLGQLGYKDDQPPPVSRWNFWTSGRYANFDDDTAGADRDGHLWWITSGLSYQISQSMTVGAFSRIRQGKVDSDALDANLDSDFYGGGAFISIKGASGLRLLAGGLYETGDNDISIAGAVGSFDTDQVTLEAKLDQRFKFGHHWIEPAVKVLYSKLSRGSYTDSLGAVVQGSDLKLGRLTVGPTIGTTWQNGNATIKPFVRINGVWDFVNEGDFIFSTGPVVSAADTAINAGGGVEISLTNGFVARLAGDWYGFEGALTAWSLTGGIGMPASLLGLDGFAGAGFVSLDLASNTDTSRAVARLRIPLDGSK